jgi:hypothetical protein
MMLLLIETSGWSSLAILLLSYVRLKVEGSKNTMNKIKLANRPL